MPTRAFLIYQGQGQSITAAKDHRPSFQMSAASCQSFPTFSQTTTYFPVTSCGFRALRLQAERADLARGRTAAGRPYLSP
jgi:hypothetical protein